MNKTKLTFVAAALCGGLLALAPMSGANAAPVAPIGKAATENNFCSPVYYGYYHHRHHHYRYYHHRHHRHCCGATAIGIAVGGKERRAVKRLVS
jgi:Spy/CpxP family protein refolding chaperone